MSDRIRRLAAAPRHPLWVLLAAALWLATAGNLPLWRALQQHGLLQGWRGLGFALGLALALTASLVLLLGPLAWRRTLRPALAALLLLSAAGLYFMLAYGIVIDRTMLVNVIQTNPAEAADLMSLPLAATLVLMGVGPAWLAWRTPLTVRPWRRQVRDNLLAMAAALLVLVVTVLAIFQPLSSAVRNHRPLRYLVNPLNTLAAAAELAGARLRAPVRPLQPLGRDAVLARPAGARPVLLALVVGETARADHFALNGYARATTPQLAARGVLSQRNAWSCGTSTAASLPCMFSHETREGYEALDAPHENLLDVLQRAGLAVLWLDNQAGCKGVCDRVPHASTAAAPPPSLCDDTGECRDEALLEGLDARLAALDAGRRARGVVLVMHMMGSHGPAYHKRTAAAYKRFVPECTSAALQDCSREEVINAYDNTLLYTDHVLARTIDWLRERAATYDSALLYVSDHGESLGENNLYLHGLPWSLAPDVQKRVPWITWLSPAYTQRSGITGRCLGGRLDEQLGHEHLFHSVLGLLEVHTGAYLSARDFYRGCRTPAA